MRAITITATAASLGLALIGGAALAQSSATATAGASATAAPAPPAMNVFATSPEVQALIANARKMHKDEPNLSQRILTLAPYAANLEYRTATAPATVHEKDIELFYVIEGAATVVTGGKLVDEKRTNDANLAGTGITGGQSRPIAKGDIFIVPQNTPHQIKDPQGGPVIVMTFHAPRG